jgi:hypothetical protein
MRRVVLLALLAPALASAEPDLALHHEPPALRMRPKQARPPKPAVVAAVLPAAPAAAEASSSFAPLPTSARDLADRVIVRVRAGYELDGAPASGQTFVGGASLPAQFSGVRPWILGDAVVGARDIVLPSLGGYFLSSFQYDTNAAIPSRTALVVPGDATDQRFAIKAGYAEYGTDDRDPDQHLWVRAGRQYRLDSGAMFAYFDGATVGLKEPAWNVSAFAGQRVALYVDTPTGVELGATAALDLQRANGVPVKLAADFMALSIDSQVRSLVALAGSSDPSPELHVDVRARAVDGGTGLGFGRADARVRWTPRRDLVLIADIEQRSGGDVAYDLAAPSAVDIVEVAQKLGVGLAAPIDATTIGARADFHRGPYEVMAFGRVEAPEGATTSVDQEGWLELGAAFVTLIAGTWTTAQYTLRQYFLDDSANAAGSTFGNTAGSGIARMHEVAVDSSWRPSGGGARRWRLSAGIFYRLYDLESPYLDITNDGRVGGRAQVQWWYTRELHVEVAADVAQSDPLLQRELGVMASARAAVEARW